MGKYIKKTQEYKKLALFLLWCFFFGISNLFGEALDRPRLTEKERGKLKEMIVEYYKKTDSLRYYWHKGQLREKLGIEKGDEDEAQIYSYLLYQNAGVVYGRVEKVEGHPEDSVYHTWVYIKPYRTFKNIVTDSNGYTVVKECSGPGGASIAGMRPFMEGEDALVFLQDIPWSRLGMSGPQGLPSIFWEKALEEKKLPLTLTESYYEFWDAFIIENNGILQHMPRGYGPSWPRFEISKVLEELEKAETKWKKYIGEIMEEK